MDTFKDKPTQRPVSPWWKSFKRNWEYKVAFFIGIYFLISHVILETTDHTRERGLNNHLRVLPQEVIEHYDATREFDNADFNVEKFAYVQYATNYDYLNLAILNFIHLRKSGTKIPNLVIIYDQILQFVASDKWSDLYQIANYYKIKVKSARLLVASYSDTSSWAASFTKFHIFNLEEYERIVYFDSDSMFVNVPKSGDIDFNTLNNTYSNIDELFKLPREISFALPQAYWLNNVVEGKGQLKAKKKIEIPDKRRHNLRMKKLVNDIKRCGDPSREFELLPQLLYEQHKFDNFDNFFANHVMVITPSKATFKRLMKYVHNPWYWSFTNRANVKKGSDYDMEILNKFIDNELRKNKHDYKFAILPHRVYGVLTGEFREEWHERFVVEPQYLPFIKKKSNKGWEPMEIFRSLKMIHFSDSPIPKPWEDENNYDPYNTKKIFCKDGDMEQYNEQFPSEFKPRLVEDCASVDIWNWFRKEYFKQRQGFWFSD
ncbi:alphaN-acetylglucosamine transferase [Spathaspora passalidarum NRRL Y-27907]|uniref:AlphaN-acetylglucosamine transferase n=1 Tax=Spathaspora passalidarum (strain NRRL Y-27907 / 11-Y1) TaxID=619300 RepID=G3ALY3_SPAPN|nr:alphaN-acetylglucosamine transferase [Spathaspora passalidarum NRRL Y-27907]EGW33336.1 alphaN-acetylglucosamine transferase [Spathaspora passalidarum NRRL Y-27907]